MSRLLSDTAAGRFAGKKKPVKVVLIPCIACALLIIFVIAENLLWRITDYYPAALARVRYVDDASLLTPAAIRDICHTPLTQPELRIKSGVLYLRCGTPGLEGVWRIEQYN